MAPRSTTIRIKESVRNRIKFQDLKSSFFANRLVRFAIDVSLVLRYGFVAYLSRFKLSKEAYVTVMH